MFQPQYRYYDTWTPKSPYGPSAYDPMRYVPAYTTYPQQHTRHASYDRPYTSPPLPRYPPYQEAYVQPIKVDTDFAAQTDRMRAKAAKSSSKKSPLKKERISVKIIDEDVECEYRSPKGTPPPPYDQRHAQYDHYDSPPAYKTRARASSSPQKPTHRPEKPERPAKPEKPARQPSTKTKKSSTPKPSRKATAKDAAKAGIPEGYSLKNWDPEEEPILLLGSVFDANTLGKWIYDWTVFHHGAGAPMADHAGELWLALIELASKLKRSEDCVSRIRRRSKRALVDEFIEEGIDFLYRLDAILRSCESYMWDAARRENGGVKTKTLGSSSGCAFVDAIFGRDRELERTEKLMADVRYWTHRFNTLCEPILRHPKD